MEFNYSYFNATNVASNANDTDMSFAPDTLREPTFFRGELRERLAFREAISALHDVVVSDLRWHPKDRTEYKAWLVRQEEIDWVQVGARRKEVAAQIESIRAEMDQLRQDSERRMKPFLAAQRRYFKHLYDLNRDWWFVLDPVITVHPDEVFFECFSQDESSYGRLSAGYEVFDNIGEFSCGTTNIDYSSALYDEFQKIRSYKTTKFEIDPRGFEVETSGEADSHKEVKIDLPDSWVRGFLQVSSAMALPATKIELHPLDVHNICFILRRHKELVGPRSMRYIVTPGEPVRIVFEPWNIELECPRSIYAGHLEDEIRVWGRRRIHILERLIPVARGFSVYLLGKGMPSFYVADLGSMSFTLGLSGWTANDWSSTANFDLLAPRADVDALTAQRVFDALKSEWSQTPDVLAERLALDRATVLGALSAYTQAGRAIWDLNKHVYRARELSREPLPMDQLAFNNEREQAATRLLRGEATKITNTSIGERQVLSLQGSVKDKNKTLQPMLRLDADERLVEAHCTCNWHQQNQLRKGPCEHILALRLAHARRSRPAAK